MKIGLIVSFFDFRADVRDLIKELQNQGHQIVLFCRESEKSEILKFPVEALEYRVIQEERRSFLNRLLEYGFLFFKRIPLSRHNYFLMELFKISNSAGSTLLPRLVLYIQKLKLNFFSYDFLLHQLSYSGKTYMDDVDQFIGFTEFQSDYFASRLLKEKRPFRIYVYSWDHPCKHTRFSKNFKYLVWSQEILKDLVSLQGVPSGNISVCGSTQFTYIHDFLRSAQENPAPKGNKYLYYCCAIGISGLIRDEVELIRLISESLHDYDSEIKLVVRPYPLLKDQNLYQPLTRLTNVEFDDDFRREKFADFRAASFDKFQKMRGAMLVLHSGSTIGLEACLLGVPSVLVDFGYGNNFNGLSIYGFIHQYQNEKYLLEAGLGMKSPDELAAVLSNLDAFRIKSAEVASGFQLLPMQELASRLAG